MIVFGVSLLRQARRAADRNQSLSTHPVGDQRAG
jgi:hypothetical protein